jgi:hypothetical protein
MKQLIFSFLIVVSCSISFAQQQWIYGIHLTGALTRFVDFSSSDGQFAKMDYGFKPSAGGGVNINFNSSEKLSYQLSAGFMQRGTLFASSEAVPAPRFRLNYSDVMLGINYKPGASGFTLGGGVSQHTLISAGRFDFVQIEDVRADFNSIDAGLYLKTGYEMPFGQSTMWLNLILNMGGINVYDGLLRENGLRGRNLVLGVQAGYIIGRLKKGVENGA